MSVQTLTQSTRRRHIQLHSLLNLDVLALILESADLTTIPNIRLVCRQLNRVAIPILVRSVVLRRSGETTLSFCRFMVFGPGRQFAQCIRQLIVHPNAHKFARASSDRSAVLSDLLARMLRTLTGLSVLRLVDFPEALQPSTRNAECSILRHVELNILCSPVPPQAQSVWHLSVEAISPALATELSSTIVFPNLRSFAGPIAIFVSLSLNHALEHISLREHQFDAGQPSWISTNDTLSEVLMALRRVRPKTISIGIDIDGAIGLRPLFWHELASAAPEAESLSLTLPYRNYVSSIGSDAPSFETLETLQSLRRVWLHVFDDWYTFDLEWHNLTYRWNAVLARSGEQPVFREVTQTITRTIRSAWQRCLAAPHWDTFLLRVDCDRGTCVEGWQRHREGPWNESHTLMHEARDKIMFTQSEDTITVTGWGG
ncbi:uncharacterized protein STEHIDRAFT_116262 [Stereum hirsutum FP-91666 SS1]|uniref:F-box domain-containing protein n=1 Tax=Stereum hirsutum (strain FP-91666) TaxID=721885 RepID=R7RWT1_STEHR|nr:uncharacterized protein STEHIDRAFT_116262 [Stereum hirsutum FP-91666 SS1]EIM79779.1 hypothetical protein STEHIDRAFT_116262 [Stereum hirsutum FP-91666 SS1]